MYGIGNCDTVKKARAWLAARGIDCRLHDFRKGGVPPAQLDAWLEQFGWEQVVNRKGTTWRTLDPALQQQVCGKAGARSVLLQHPSAIKRPIVQWAGGERTLGFDPDQWALLAVIGA